MCTQYMKWLVSRSELNSWKLKPNEKATKIFFFFVESNRKEKLYRTLKLNAQTLCSLISLQFPWFSAQSTSQMFFFLHHRLFFRFRSARHTLVIEFHFRSIIIVAAVCSLVVPPTGHTSSSYFHFILFFAAAYKT